MANVFPSREVEDTVIVMCASTHRSVLEPTDRVALGGGDHASTHKEMASVFPSRETEDTVIVMWEAMFGHTIHPRTTLAEVRSSKDFPVLHSP